MHNPGSIPRRSIWRKALAPVGALVVLLGLALLGPVGCGRGEGGAGEGATVMPQRPPAMVTTAEAITRDVPIYLDQIGKTVAIEQVSIIPQVGGKIVAAHVDDGAEVRKGQLLFEIDPRPFEAAVATDEATLLQNQAELELAQSEYKRVQGLIGSSAVSQLEYDQKKSALAVAEGKVKWAEANLRTSRLNLEYSKIYSPIDGRAGALLIDPGNVVKENDQPILNIQRLDPIYAEFTITENELGTVRKIIAQRGLDLGTQPERGLKVEVDVPGDAARVLTALGNPAAQRPASSQPTTRPQAGPRQGTLTFLDNAVQSGTGTVRLRATLPNADRYFWPGQFVNVKLILAVKKGAVLVPTAAQQIGQQGPYVYVVTNGTAQIRPIVPGQRQDDLLVVDQGLQPGEKVIVTGQMAVTPNGKVMVTNEGPNGGVPGQAPPPGGASARAE